MHCGRCIRRHATGALLSRPGWRLDSSNDETGGSSVGAGRVRYGSVEQAMRVSTDHDVALSRFVKVDQSRSLHPGRRLDLPAVRTAWRLFVTKSSGRAPSAGCDRMDVRRPPFGRRSRRRFGRERGRGAKGNRLRVRPPRTARGCARSRLARRCATRNRFGSHSRADIRKMFLPFGRFGARWLMRDVTNSRLCRHVFVRWQR